MKLAQVYSDVFRSFLTNGFAEVYRIDYPEYEHSIVTVRFRNLSGFGFYEVTISNERLLSSLVQSRKT